MFALGDDGATFDPLEMGRGLVAMMRRAARDTAGEVRALPVFVAIAHQLGIVAHEDDDDDNDKPRRVYAPSVYDEALHGSLLMDAHTFYSCAMMAGLFPRGLHADVYPLPTSLTYAGPVVTSVADISMFASDTNVDPFEDNNYVTCVNYDAESLEILGKGCSAVKAELDANPAAYAGLVESDNDLALVEYATRYDRDFALTCADAATKSATASITKVACPATLGVVAVTPANGHDRCYSGGVYYPAKPDLTSADACAVPGLPTTTAAPGAVRGVEHRRAGEREHHVPQLRQHPPRAVHAECGWRRHAEVLPEGCLRLRRRRDGGARCHKDVESTVEGSELTMMAEAGVTATLDVVAKDVESNRIYAGGERSKLTITGSMLDINAKLTSVLLFNPLKQDTVVAVTATYSGSPVRSSTTELGITVNILPIRLAMFSPNGLGMDLYWRYPSSFVAENPTKDCSALFVAETVGKLGYAPTCKFTTNKVLHVQFGPRATVLPSDDLVTLTNSVQLTCNSAEILDGCANGPVENSMTVQARIPYNAIVPTAIITAPEKVGKCDLAEISARLSQGFAGRSMKYVWGVEGGSVTPELLKAVAAMDTKTIQIPSAYLVQDAMYTFTLQATNYMGKTSIVARADVTKSLDPVPYLVINGLAKQDITTTMPVTITTDARRDPGDCFAHVARPDLFIAPGTLSPGTYGFTVTVFDEVTPEHVAVASVQLAVASRPLIAVIKDGDRTISSKRNLVLDATASFDPDDASGAGLTFMWSAELATALAQSGGTEASSVLNIPADALGAGEYTFTVTVSKGSKTPATAATSIVVVTEDIPIALIQQLADAKISADSRAGAVRRGRERD
ncbi:hypothetical protein RI054_11g58060 [Pseudoscourfieldia marina]